MRYCEKCGVSLNGYGSFCPRCGARISIPLAELVKAAQAGDQEAFGNLYEQTYRDKYYVALKYMKNEAEAEDVLQDAYVKAYSQLGSLQDPESFPSWLSMIVANTAKSALRKVRPVLFTDITPLSDEGEEEPLPEAEEVRSAFCPEENMLEKDRKVLVGELLGSLTEEQRICVMMFYLEELKVKEIADSLEINENTVKSRLFQARKALKEKAEAMKKRGYVFSIAPLNVLIRLLLAEKAQTAAAISALSLAAVGSTAGAAASATAETVSAASAASGTAVVSGAAASGAAGSSAAAGAAGFFGSIGMKIAAVALGTVLAGGAVLGGIKAIRSGGQVPGTEPSVWQETDTAAPTLTPAAEAETAALTQALTAEPETAAPTQAPTAEPETTREMAETEPVSTEMTTAEPDLYEKGEDLYALLLNYLYDEFESGWADKKTETADRIYSLLYSGWLGDEEAAAGQTDAGYQALAAQIKRNGYYGIQLESFGLVAYDMIYLGNNKSGMRYGFLDLDDDGVPELILCPAGDSADYWSIFSLREGIPSGGGLGGIRRDPSEFQINEDKTLYQHIYPSSGEVYQLSKWNGETLKETRDLSETADWPKPMKLDFKTFDAYHPRMAALPEAFAEGCRLYEALLAYLEEQLKTDWNNYDGRYLLDAVREFGRYSRGGMVSLGFADINDDAQPELFLSGGGNIFGIFTLSEGNVQSMLDEEARRAVIRITLFSDHTVETERMVDAEQSIYIQLRAGTGEALLTEVSRSWTAEESYRYTSGEQIVSMAGLPLREYIRSQAESAQQP